MYPNLDRSCSIFESSKKVFQSATVYYCENTQKIVFNASWHAGKNLFWAGVHESKMNLQDKKTVLQGLSKGSQVRSFLNCINLNALPFIS